MTLLTTLDLYVMTDMLQFFYTPWTNKDDDRGAIMGVL